MAATSTAAADSYPRPDFERSNLRWESLNGPWDFLFDDEDIGLQERWQQSTLPAEVALQGEDSSSSWAGSDAHTITQKIAAFPEKLLDDFNFTRWKGTTNQKRSIKVPYVFQCPASGINERSPHEVLWYERTISDLRNADEKARGDRLLARFGAVDYYAKIWLDGSFVGEHTGGHVPFDIDLTDAVAASPSTTHRLTLRIFDSTADLAQPRGKQYWGAKPESIFYTPSSGIWQNVWLETVPAARIADSSGGTVLRSNDIESGNLHATVAVQGRRAGQTLTVEIEASLGGIAIAKSDKTPFSKEADLVSFDVQLGVPEKERQALPDSLTSKIPSTASTAFHPTSNVALWSPSHPLLYDLTLRLFSGDGTLLDEVHTTTGMRSLDWTTGDSTFRLNGQPLFHALNLDQGYWPDTFMTPPSPAHLKADIEIALAMGFNGCRKHQKVEDPIFLYYADQLGYMVWGEMANAYAFGPAYPARFDAEWAAAVRRDINHPSIVAWTPINESWGYTDLQTSQVQRDHIHALYYATKVLDPTRPVNDNCGWEHVAGDFTSFHDYADAPELAVTCSAIESIIAPKAGRQMFTPGRVHNPGAPVICTEFGGVNIAIAKGDKPAHNELDWGYTTASDPADLLKRVDALAQAVVGGGLVCGFVYTQLADIEQEVNGLYAFDRRPKLDAGAVKDVIQRAAKVYYDKIGVKGT